MQQDCSSEMRSGVTETVISVVSTRTRGKTIEVAGGESLSGDVLSPRQR